MKKYLEKQKVFDATLRFLSFLSRWKNTERFIHPITNGLAKLNIQLNKPAPTSDLEDLAKTWQTLMPPDGQEYYQISEITDYTAYVEIHLHCPLRGTDKVGSCYKWMNYDRKLMEAVGASLIVLESQSNSGKNFCRLAIRKKEAGTADLKPAHKS